MPHLLALFGCTGTSSVALTRAPDDAEHIDGSYEEEEEEEEEPAEEQPFGCADIYAEDLLPTFEIEISDADWAGLEADFASPGACGSLEPKPYHPLEAFRYGDEVMTGASIRLKGNECFSWIPPKMQFVVSMDEVDPDARFHGLRKVNFDAPWYDGSLLHERLAGSFLRDVGLPGLCANNSRLIVNGEYYGAYANSEHMDRELLERVFGDDDAGGTLYKYGTTPVANDEAADSGRLSAFWAAADPATLAPLGDMDQWLAEWAAEAVMPDGDGYQCCAHNWMLYDHPSRGFLFVPYDLDYTFDGGDLYYPISAQADPLLSTWGYPQHFAGLTADPEWRPRYIDAVATMRAGYDVAELLDRVERWSAQIAEAVEEDPNRTFTMEDHERAVQLLKDFLPQRAAWLDAWVESAAP